MQTKVNHVTSRQPDDEVMKAIDNGEMCGFCRGFNSASFPIFTFPTDNVGYCMYSASKDHYGHLLMAVHPGCEAFCRRGK